MARYTRPQLIIRLLRDVISDLRDMSEQLDRPGFREAIAERAAFIRDVFTRRRTLQLDRYGWPIL